MIRQRHMQMHWQACNDPGVLVKPVLEPAPNVEVSARAKFLFHLIWGSEY